MTPGPLDLDRLRMLVFEAVIASTHSPCRSKRGVAIADYNGRIISTGYNYQAAPFTCDSSPECKARCRQTAVHAEQAALLGARGSLARGELVHAKTVNGELVASGGPSCASCSKLIVAAGIDGVWLFHDTGWRRYHAHEFHQLSVVADTPVLSRLQASEARVRELEMASRVPGIKAVHAIVTPTCRANRTDLGAFVEATRRLQAEYLACLEANSSSNFHIVLTVERPEPEEPRS